MSGFGRGAGYLGHGFATWRTRPRLMLLGMLPALIVFLVLLSLVVALLLNIGSLVLWATPFADDWSEGVRGLVRFFVGLALVAGALLLSVSLFVGLTLSVGDPFYEHIWRETEAALGGQPPGDGPGFWSSAADGLTLAAVGLASSLVVVVSGFVPLVGPVVAIVLGTALSGRLLARELLSRPLGARGMDRAAQLRLLSTQRSAVLGFGVVTQLCFLVPLGGVVAMPAAVVGSTLLSRDLLGEADVIPR